MIGKDAEDRVLQEYVARGYTYIDRNVRSYGHGRGQKSELDLLLQKGSILICVEVKQRSSSFVPIQETITRAKLNHMRYGVQKFLQQHPQYQDFFVRFDAAFVQGEKIEILENIG